MKFGSFYCWLRRSAFVLELLHSEPERGAAAAGGGGGGAGVA